MDAKQVDLKSFVDEVIAKVQRKVGMPQGGGKAETSKQNNRSILSNHVVDLVHTL